MLDFSIIPLYLLSIHSQCVLQVQLKTNGCCDKTGFLVLMEIFENRAVITLTWFFVKQKAVDSGVNYLHLFCKRFSILWQFFFGLHRFLYYWYEILCVKIKTFAWKNSFLCAWKLTDNRWNLKEKVYVKNPNCAWKFWKKYIREKRLP